MRIAFDVDNVLADTTNCWCKKASKYLDRAVTKSDIRSHKIVGSVPMSPDDIFKLQDEVWAEWRVLPTTEENLSGKLDILRNNGFQVLVATSRPLRSVGSVKKWLNLQGIHYDEFHALGPYKSKIEVEANALVDDAPDQIREFTRANRKGFLYTQPWNRNAKVWKAVIVKSINDVLAFYHLRV